MQLRSHSLDQCMLDTIHPRRLVTDDDHTSRRNFDNQQFSDTSNNSKLPLDETVSDTASKLENFDNSQPTSHRRSKQLKHGTRCGRRSRKSETSSKANTDIPQDATAHVATIEVDTSKPESFRVKIRKRKRDRKVEKSEPDTEVESDSEKKAECASDDTVYTCEDCGKEFPSANVLTRHKRTHTTRIFHCNECATDFTEPMAFKRHSVVMHKIHRPFTCSHSDCNYRSDRLSNVEKHMSIHSPTHAFACSLCGRTFAQDAGLRSHLLSCMSSRTFLCDLCGSAFNHLQSMQSHQRVHTGERPYRCTDCESTFADHRNYKRHRRIHENAFPYECMLCGKRFRHSNSLKSHLGSHGILTKPAESAAVTSAQSSQIGSPSSHVASSSSHLGSFGNLTKPVETSSGSTPSHSSHTLAHTAF